ncbi:outer membrane beta-barrel protein [Pseudorhodoferax sp.]|uniref:outer membrane beta-barrel protein n=1 Tax=Pseudorhodoferax sp. TaxID=1993553 RepID=UPI0039E2F85F
MNSLRMHAALAAGLLACGTALAQSANPNYDLGRSGSAWAPGAGAYAGASLGRPSYRLDCAGSCDQPSLSGHVYVGSMFTPNLGAELGLLYLGEAERGGGDTRAEGVNFSLLGRADIGAGFGVFGRVGATWGRTRVDAAPGSGLATGRASGWGPAYGLGVDWAFARNWSAVLDWQRHRFDFAGGEDGWVRATSIGLKYRF